MDARTPSRTLFILAGMPGSGKTHLLHLALSKQLPIFGKCDDALFQQTRRPSVYPEERMRLDERLREGTWVSEWEIFRVPASARSSARVVHLDLFWFLQVLQFADESSAPVPRADYLCSETLCDAASLEAGYRALLTASAFRQWDRIAVNTLHPPYTRTVTQWVARESTIERPERIKASPPARFLQDELYAHTESGQQMYDTFYQGWQRAIGALEPAVSLVTEVGDDHAFRIVQQS